MDRHLIVSTDFWHEAIDTGDRQAFGVPVRIFTPQDIRQIVAIAAGCGFQAIGIIEFHRGKTTVRWHGLECTFIDFSLKPLD